MRITILIAAFLPLLGCTEKTSNQSEEIIKTLTESRWKYDAEGMAKLLAETNHDGTIAQRMDRNIKQMEGGHFIFNPDGRLQILLPKINIRGEWKVEDDGQHLNLKVDGSLNVKHPIVAYSPEKISLGIDQGKISFPKVFVPVKLD